MSKHNRSWAKKKVLVTGGLGFIGSNLAIRLAELEADITIVDAMIPDFGGNYINIEPVRNRVRVNIEDMRDENTMAELVKGQDVIFNLAGQVSHISSMENPYKDLEINCQSQLGILEACRKNNRSAKIIFAGTRGQYGRPERLPVDEAHPLCPIDINGINKITGERYHLLYNDTYNLRSCSLRLTNTYGPRHQMKNSLQGIVNWFIRLAIENKAIPIFGDGSQMRDCNYVDDIVDAFLLAAETEQTNGKFYNLGSGSPKSLLSLAEKIIEIAGSGHIEKIKFPEDALAIEIGSYYADYNKFMKTTGWKPNISLEEGLKRTIEYYRTNLRHYI